MAEALVLEVRVLASNFLYQTAQLEAEVFPVLAVTFWERR